MKAELWREMWRIFEEALEIPATDREAFLKATCGENSELRRTVEELLAVDGEGSMLDQPVVSPPGPEDRLQPGPRPVVPSGEPSSIGPYRLLRRLGQGGMGVVHLAVRDDDTFKRRVVIKLVRPELGRDDLPRRLRAERQILAGLDHPGIARLYDGGSTLEGLPYFVMEHVEGMPIDTYCDHNRLDIPARLHLFRRVCDAVEYAHRNLVIHRDLKPSNIFVTAEGEPKLLDFGIAKLLNPELAAPELEPTATWQRPLTPSYASPEQVRGGPVTTASDVYSLGVLLYKLLTGRLPHRFPRRTPQDIERILIQEEPPRPSAVVTASGAPPQDSDAGAPATDELKPEIIASARRTTPAELARRLKGDLDAIVLKALRPAPRERYGSVERFAEDLVRALEGQPVMARRGTRRYRASRFLRRHRTAVGALTALILSLLVFAAVMARQSTRLARQRDQVLAERDAKENVTRLLLDIFQVADPFSGDGAGEALTVREALERSGPLLEQRLRRQPAQRAEILHATGLIYRNLGLLDRAQDRLEAAVDLRRALGRDALPELTESLTVLADILLNQGREARAQEVAEEALTLARGLDTGTPEQSTSPLIQPLSGLVGVLCSLKEYDRAEPLALEALALTERLPEDDPRRPTALLHQAAIQNGRQRYSEAVDLYRQALALERAILGDEHPSLAVILNNLGIALRRLDRLEEAAAVMGEVLELQRKTLGEEHPEVTRTLNNLGGIAEARGDSSTALRYFQQASELLRQTGGPDHPRIFFLQIRIYASRLRMGEARTAEQGLRRALAQWRDRLGEGHRFVHMAVELLAETLVAQGRLQEAEGLQLDLLERTETPQRPDLLQRISKLYRHRGYPEEAARFEGLPEPSSDR